MNSHWQRELKAAEKRNLTVTEGSDDSLFETFITMYKEMVSRKKFVEPNDINQFRMIQRRLPEPLKMKIMLCSSGEGMCSGAICSAIGKTAMYLFGATSDVGIKSKGSYLLQWRLIDQLKRDGIAVYDLNGVNPEANPGTYKFKNDLAGKNGREVRYLGRFDSHGTLVSRLFVQGADVLRAKHRSLKEAVKNTRGANVSESLRAKNGDGAVGKQSVKPAGNLEPVVVSKAEQEAQGAHRE
jgi:lipid II:glycine glycyltransferase (peptidoglycan interpeptide bridge formation enzyme)